MGELKQSDTAAKEILAMAKNRLNKFYNPKLYKPSPVEEPTFVQISAHSSNKAAPHHHLRHLVHTQKKQRRAPALLLWTICWLQIWIRNCRKPRSWRRILRKNMKK